MDFKPVISSNILNHFYCIESNNNQAIVIWKTIDNIICKQPLGGAWCGDVILQSFDWTLLRRTADKRLRVGKNNKALLLCLTGKKLL